MNWIDKMLSSKESRNVKLSLYTFFLFFLLFLLVHLIVAYPKIVHAWDGTDLSTDTDVSIGNGTRETITDTIVVAPGYEVPVTDSNEDTSDLEVTSIIETPAGITQIEVHDYETNESTELEMNNR